MDNLTIRPLVAADKGAWRVLWTAYLEFYDTTVTEEVYETYFDRLMGSDPQDYNGLIALYDGKPIGLTHYVFHRHGWTIENTCYLQDLYVDPSVRGTGAGRALIEGVYAAADAAEIAGVYWTTQEDNQTARLLYDRIGEKTPFIKYKRV